MPGTVLICSIKETTSGGSLATICVTTWLLPLQSSIIPSKLKEPIPSQFSPLSSSVYKEQPPQVHQEFCCSPNCLITWWRGYPLGPTAVIASGWLNILHIIGTNMCIPQAFRNPFLQYTREVQAFCNCRALVEFRLWLANLTDQTPFLLLFWLFGFFWPHRVACRILVPWPGIEPVPPVVEAQSPNHWTSREVLKHHLFLDTQANTLNP